MSERASGTAIHGEICTTTSNPGAADERRSPRRPLGLRCARGGQRESPSRKQERANAHRSTNPSSGWQRCARDRYLFTRTIMDGRMSTESLVVALGGTFRTPEETIEVLRGDIEMLREEKKELELRNKIL